MAKHKPGRKIDQTGRSRGEGKHVRLYEWQLTSPAFRSLNCHSRCLLIELKRLFNGENNGRLAMSVRQAAALLGCDVKTARKAFAALEDRGFVLRAQAGSFDRKVRHATTWILTEFPVRDGLPTKEFMRWRPPGEIQNTVGARPTDSGSTSHRDRPTNLGKGPDSGSTSHRDHTQPPPDGGSTSHTYKLPCGRPTAGDVEEPRIDSQSPPISKNHQLDLGDFVDAPRHLPPAEHLRRRLRQHVTQRNICLTDAACAVGKSRSTLSHFLAGRFAKCGQSSALLSAIARYVDQLDREAAA